MIKCPGYQLFDKRGQVMQNEEKIWNLVHAKKENLIALANRVVSAPETVFRE